MPCEWPSRRPARRTQNRRGCSRYMQPQAPATRRRAAALCTVDCLPVSPWVTHNFSHTFSPPCAEHVVARLRRSPTARTRPAGDLSSSGQCGSEASSCTTSGCRCAPLSRLPQRFPFVPLEYWPFTPGSIQGVNGVFYRVVNGKLAHRPPVHGHTALRTHQCISAGLKRLPWCRDLRTKKRRRCAGPVLRLPPTAAAGSLLLPYRNAPCPVQLGRYSCLLRCTVPGA
jgi:hypothetical protein